MQRSRPLFPSLVPLTLCLVLLAAPAAAETNYTTLATASQEVPVELPSSGTARATVTFNEGYSRINVRVRFHDLEGAVLAAHFHCNVAGANGPLALGLVEPGPLFVDGNRIVGTLRNADFPTEDMCLDVIGRPVNNVASLAAAMKAGLIYLNVHTSEALAGEVRGQLHRHSVDE